MKQLHLLFSAIFICITSFVISAQDDMTDLIINPSFEDDAANVNLPDMPTGWLWIGTDGYAWCGVNTDAEDTSKTDLYIAGTWNAAFGDIELSQTVSGLDNGMYTVTCDLMGGSSNATTSRMTTQRLFAETGSGAKCMLYGAEEAESYSADNLAVLGATEDYSFGGYAEFASDKTPLETLTVEVEVTDGSLTFGVRSNGTASELGYTFPLLTAGNGHGWFKVDNFTLTYLGPIDAIKNSTGNNLKVSVNNGFVSVYGTDNFEVYNITGSLIPSNQQLSNGIYIIKVNNSSKKIVIQ